MVVLSRTQLEALSRDVRAFSHGKSMEKSVRYDPNGGSVSYSASANDNSLDTTTGRKITGYVRDTEEKLKLRNDTAPDFVRDTRQRLKDSGDWIDHGYSHAHNRVGGAGDHDDLRMLNEFSYNEQEILIRDTERDLDFETSLQFESELTSKRMKETNTIAAQSRSVQDEIDRLTQRAQAAGDFWDAAGRGEASEQVKRGAMYSATDTEVTFASHATSRSQSTSQLPLGGSVYGIPRGNYRTAGGNLTLAAGSGSAVATSQLRRPLSGAHS